MQWQQQAVAGHRMQPDLSPLYDRSKLSVNAMRTTSRVRDTPNFSRSRAMWVRTVATDTPCATAISAGVNPSTKCLSTADSACVRA